MSVPILPQRLQAMAVYTGLDTVTEQLKQRLEAIK